MDVIWIDAKKRLPSEEGPYLVVLFDSFVEEIIVTKAYYYAPSDDCNGWDLLEGRKMDWAFGGAPVERCSVTHWTHLPNLPEGVK